MVATVRCEEIANEKLSCLCADEGWLALEEAVQAGPVSGFGKKLGSILEFHLSEYEEEAIYFDEGVRNAKRKQLGSKALDVVHHVYVTMLGHLRSKALESFKTRLEQSLRKGEGFAASVRTCIQSCLPEFDKGCQGFTHKYAAIRQGSWDTSEVREKLCHEIETYASLVKSSMLSETIAKYEKQLSEGLSMLVKSLFEVCKPDTWSGIRMHLMVFTDNAINKFSKAVNSFGLDRSTIETKKLYLRDYARNLVVKNAREEAGKVLFRMKDRFTMVFNHDDGSKPRAWAGKEDIITVRNKERYASLKILSVMAAMRLDKKEDNIEEVQFSSLMDGTVAVPSSEDRSAGAAMDPLVSSTWEEVASDATLLPPVQCKSLWEQFIAETEYEVIQAISSQRTAETVGTVAESTVTGVALVAVGVAVGPAAAVGGSVGLILVGSVTGIRQVAGGDSHRCTPLVETLYVE